MKKNYIVDGSFGEISKKLEDQIQDGNKQTLRERSFEELTNFIPKYDYLAETINGVKLEYLIKNEDCKIFSLKTSDVVFFFFENKIITAVPKSNKIFLDTIPQEITCNVSSISTCFKIKDAGVEKIIFNSIAGVYFCTIKPVAPELTPNGDPYFVKIEIPASLKGEEIKSTTGNIYYYNGVNSYTGNAPNFLTPQGNLTLNPLTGYYLEGSRFAIGDIIQANIDVLYNYPFFTIVHLIRKQNVKFKIVGLIAGVKINNKQLNLIYPSKIKPLKKINITFSDRINIQSNIDFLFDNAFDNFVNLYKLELFEPIPNITETISFTWTLFPSIWLDYNSTNNSLLPTNFYLSYAAGKDKSNQYSPATYYFIANSCVPNFNVKIQILQSSITQQITKLAPYTPYSLAGRLAISNQNQIKFSKSGNYADFNFNPQATPTETDAFQRTLQDVDEITFISKWGQLGTQEGFAIGTTREIIFFSSIANIFSTTILSRRNIPCSYITPLDITFASFPATLIVEAGRTRITAVIFTRDQTQEIKLTDTIDFFNTDGIAKIQAIKYGRDQMIFALTDSGNLYACLSGSERLAWFRIRLTYKLVDIASFDDGREKKLYIVSSLQNDSAYNLFGSIDFSEGSTQIKAEYFVDNSLQDDNVFDTNYPVVKAGYNVFYKTKEELTNVEKASLPKPIVCRMTLHNQEIITTKYNTKASGTKRKITNTRINVKNANYFNINYITQNISMQPITKLARKIDKINNNLDSERVETLIKVFQESSARDSAKISIETHENSIVPLTIKSISFDTEYVNPK
jgi:hypothetical protein